MSMGKKTKAANPADIIRRLSREELEALALDQLARGGDALAHAVLVRFAAAKGDSARDLVRRLLEDHDDSRYGCIRDAEGLADSLEDLRKRAGSLAESGKGGEAFALLRAVVEEVAPHCWQGDDHDGVLVGTVQDCLDEILRIASRRDADKACLAEIRGWARGSADSRWAREGNSWDLELLRLQLAASRTKEERATSLELCKEMCAPKGGDNNWDYRAEKCAETVLEALGRSRDAKEREAFVAGHLHLDTVRDAGISDALACKDFQRAQALALDGLERARGRHSFGTGDHYAALLVEVLDTAGSRGEADRLLEAWTVAERSLEWFKALKKRMAKGTAWEQIRDRVFSAIKPGEYAFLADLLASECLFERLAELAKRHSSLLGDHYKAIGRVEPLVAAGYLERLINKELERTHSRGGYEFIADKVREYARYAGPAAAAGLVDEACAQYPRRPAMIEELRKATRPRRP